MNCKTHHSRCAWSVVRTRSVLLGAALLAGCAAIHPDIALKRERLSEIQSVAYAGHDRAGTIGVSISDDASFCADACLAGCMGAVGVYGSPGIERQKMEENAGKVHAALAGAGFRAADTACAAIDSLFGAREVALSWFALPEPQYGDLERIVGPVRLPAGMDEGIVAFCRSVDADALLVVSVEAVTISRPNFGQVGADVALRGTLIKLQDYHDIMWQKRVSARSELKTDFEACLADNGLLLRDALRRACREGVALLHDDFRRADQRK